MTNNTIKQQPAVIKLDISIKIALLMGIMLLLFLLWFYPSLVLFSSYLGCIVCLGLFLLRQAGWNIRERRTKKSK